MSNRTAKLIIVLIKPKFPEKDSALLNNRRF